MKSLRLNRYLGGLISAFFAISALAHDGPHGKAASSASVSQSGQQPGQQSLKRWDFTLATLDGARFVQASKVAGPLLVNFWSRDCPPCVAELPRLQAFARNNPSWTVLLITTDMPSDASTFLERRKISIPSLRRGANVVGLMRSAGNTQGGLPFTVTLQEGIVCRTELGEVSDAQLVAIVAQCGKS